MKSNRYYLRQGWISLLGILLWTFCHTNAAQSASQAIAAANPHLLKDVWVVYQNDQWHVVLIGPVSMRYKATKTSDPLRVVVDLPNTKGKTTITSPIRENEVIGRVKTSTVVHDPQPLTRVEIRLNRDASYKIRRVEKKIWLLSLRLSKIILMSKSSATGDFKITMFLFWWSHPAWWWTCLE